MYVLISPHECQSSYIKKRFEKTESCIAPCVIMERVTRRIVSRTDLGEHIGKLVGNVYTAHTRTFTIIAVYIRVSRSEILDASLPSRFSDSRI